MAVKETNTTRKQELMTLPKFVEEFRNIQPVFHEAVQSVWFLHLILQIESSGHSLSFGRFDQFMYPYFEQDMEEGDHQKNRAPGTGGKSLAEDIYNQ